MIRAENDLIPGYSFQLPEIFRIRGGGIAARVFFIVFRCRQFAPRRVVLPEYIDPIRRIDDRQIEIIVREIAQGVHAVHIVESEI